MQLCSYFAFISTFRNLKCGQYRIFRQYFADPRNIQQFAPKVAILAQITKFNLRRVVFELEDFQKQFLKA